MTTVHSQSKGSNWSQMELRALSAALVAGIVTGLILHTTGRMESIAGIYGLSGVALGGLVHLVHSLLIGATYPVIATLLEASPTLSDMRVDVSQPIDGAVMGVGVGMVLWTLVVVIALLLWLSFVMGVDRPFPYVHLLSLGILVVFGAVLGGGYPLTRSLIDEHS